VDKADADTVDNIVSYLSILTRVPLTHCTLSVTSAAYLTFSVCVHNAFCFFLFVHSFCRNSSSFDVFVYVNFC